MIDFAAVLDSPEIVMPWPEEKVVVVSCHSFDMHQQGSDSRVMAHEALQGRYSGYDPPIHLVVFLGEGRGTLKMLYLFLTMRATQQLERSKNLHFADLEMAFGRLIAFED